MGSDVEYWSDSYAGGRPGRRSGNQMCIGAVDELAVRVSSIRELSGCDLRDIVRAVWIPESTWLFYLTPSGG